jgi:hypothetical protein
MSRADEDGQGELLSPAEPRKETWVKPELDVMSLKDAMSGHGPFNGDLVTYGS